MKLLPLFLAFVLTCSSTLAAPVDLAPGLAGALQPQLAVAPSGELWATFGSGNAIYVTSSAEGRIFAPPVKVGELEKLALRLRRGPRIAATERLLLVSAISHADGNLHLWSSADGGSTWREGARMNGEAGTAREGLHAMATDGRSTVALAWLDGRSGGNQLWSRTSRDGGLTWQSEVKIYASPEGHICQCCHPSLAVGPNGRISAMWRNSLGGARDLWTSSSADGGLTWGGAEKLGSGTWKFDACPMDGGAVAADPKGALHTVWRRDRSVFTDAPGVPEEKLAGPAAQPVLAVAADGRLATAWEEAGDIRLQQGFAARQRVATGRFPSIVRMEKLRGFFLAWDTEGHSPQGEFYPDEPTP